MVGATYPYCGTSPVGTEYRSSKRIIEVGSTSPFIADIGSGYLFLYEKNRNNVYHTAKNFTYKTVENDSPQNA